MTDEQFENRMSFIVEQQAHFVTDIQALREAQARTEGMLRQLVGVNLDFANHLQETDERLGNRIGELDEKVKEMADFQAHSDRRLDALIDVVNQYIQRRNGSGKENGGTAN